MGDRVLFQVVNSKEPGQFGPVVYGHWLGGSARELVKALRERMASRPDDIQYATARLAQECGMMMDDLHGERALGVGIWIEDHVLTEKDSHGDAGCVLIDCGDGFRCTCFGGYLEADDDGLPGEGGY